MLAAWSSDACSCARACPTKQCTTSLGPGYTANSDGSNNRCWHLCTRKPFGSTMQECAVSFFVEQHAQVSLVTLVMPDGPATEPRLAFREERLQGQRTLFCRPKLPAPEVRKALDYRGREARERCRESQAREARRQGRARRPRWTSAAALAARTNSTFVRAARAATGVRRVDASSGGHLMASARAAAGVGALGCAINDLACRRTAAGAAASTEARGSQALRARVVSGAGPTRRVSDALQLCRDIMAFGSMASRGLVQQVTSRFQLRPRGRVQNWHRESQGDMLDSCGELVHGDESTCRQSIDSGRTPLVDGSARAPFVLPLAAESMPAASSSQGTCRTELVPSRRGQGGGPRVVCWVGASTGAGAALWPRSAAGKAGGAWFGRSDGRHGGASPSASGLAERTRVDSGCTPTFPVVLRGPAPQASASNTRGMRGSDSGRKCAPTTVAGVREVECSPAIRRIRGKNINRIESAESPQA